MNIRIQIAVYLILLFPAFALADGGHAHGPDGSHISDSFQTGSAGDVVLLSKEAEKNLDLKTITLKTVLAAPTKTLYGRVISDPRRVSVVAAPFSGKVEKLFVLPGTFVSKGEELIKVTPIQVGAETTVIRAKESGYVTELTARPGEVFEPTHPLLTISDLDVILFEGDLFDSTVTEDIKNSASCTVHTKRYPGKHFSCQVETVDATFRGNPPVGHVHASIKNTDSELKPGMTGQIHLSIGESSSAILVPREAVLGKFEKQFVYLKKTGKYHKTAIKLGDNYGDEVKVIEGLSKGDVVVVQGQYQLQFAKSDLTEHDLHNHDDHEDEHAGDKHLHASGEEHNHADHDSHQHGNSHSHKEGGHSHKH